MIGVEGHLELGRSHRAQLDEAADPDPAVRVGFDLLLTDSLARLGYHMRYGKVVPDRLDGNWNFGRKAMYARMLNYDEEFQQVLQIIKQSPSLQAMFDYAEEQNSMKKASLE